MGGGDLKVDTQSCSAYLRLGSFFWSVFSPNAGKYGPEEIPYLDTFHAVSIRNLNKTRK